MKKIVTLFILIIVVFVMSFQNSSAQYSLFEDFESGNWPPDNWNNPGKGVLWNQAFYSAYGNGNYCAYYDFYSCGNWNDTLLTPVFDQTGANDSLVFDHAYAPYNSGGRDFYDFLDIYTSTNGGDTYSKYLHINCRNLRTADGTNNPFFPNTDQWGRYSTVLPSGVNRIKFVAFNNCANNLFLDNIGVLTGAPPFTDAAVTVYSKGRFPRTFLTNDTISANIRNTGNIPISNLKVYMSMSGANTISDSAFIPFLDGGADQVVSFKPFTPIINGNSVVSVWIPHNDEDPNNDSAIYNSNVNSNYFAYVDTTNNYNGGLGFFDPVYFLQKFRISNANSRITEVRYKIPNFDSNPIGQTIKGVVVNSAGVIVAKSDPYVITAADLNNFVSLKITNPIPFYPVTNESYFYAGMETSEAVGGDFFWNATNQDENPRRTNAFFMGFGGMKNTGETIGFLSDDFGKYGINVQVNSIPAVDVAIASLNSTYNQFYTTTSAPQTGKVSNNAITGTAVATVIRKIGGGYTSTVTNVSIPANSTVNVTFTNFTFTSGTTYTIRDSIILTGDGNLSNNVLSAPYTPRVAKSLLVLYQKNEDKDSIVRAINTDGRYANNFDTVGVTYPGSFRPWKIVFDVTKAYRVPYSDVRDSLKSFIDNSTAGANKKTLVFFGNQTADRWDPASNAFSFVPADSIFLRQYLKAKYVNTNWLGNIPSSDGKFNGKGFFSGVTQDSLSYNAEFGGDEIPDLIAPTNGSSVAFLPNGVLGNGTDSAIAVSFSGANYNTFFMSNRFSALRASSSSPSSPMGPVKVYTKIIDWIQSVNTGVKVLDLTSEIQGFYDPSANSMAQDTMRVYLRSSINPYPKVDSAKAYLNSAGQASFVFNNAANGTQYYIQLKHRNGLETWSKTTQSFSSNHLTYDFTTGSAKAFGDNMILQGSKWVIYTGDVDQNGIIDLTDLVLVFNDASAFVTGYVKTDVNGDNITDLTDLVLTFNNSGNFVVAKSPLAPEDLIKLNETESIQLPLQIDARTANGFAPENKIDHGIYDRFKNEQSKERIKLPDYKTVKPGEGERLIRSNRNLR